MVMTEVQLIRVVSVKTTGYRGNERRRCRGVSGLPALLITGPFENIKRTVALRRAVMDPSDYCVFSIALCAMTSVLHCVMAYFYLILGG